jgi:2-oxoglutarate dehydrogenase E2 component (dihydrolipoamide succinyltransferase)
MVWRMPMTRRRHARAAAAGLVALALGPAALPTAALAQSAGDDQYQDPFGGGSSPSSAPTPQPAVPAPSAPAAAPAQAAPAAAPAATAAQAAPAPELPYTGSPVDAGLLAAAGGVLLASGLTLRVRLRERDGA